MLFSHSVLRLFTLLGLGTTTLRFMSSKYIFNALRTLLCVAATITGTAAFAQFDAGSFIGTVHDSSGAAVKGATVTVTNIGTSITASPTTNESGGYEIPSLRVGSYNISAVAAGFAPAQASNVGI